eukprot:586742-Rhodomonas_salina.1
MLDYVKAVDDSPKRIPLRVRRLMDEFSDRVDGGGEDFETARDIFYAVHTEYNNRYWALTPRNMHMAINFQA